MSRVLTQPEQEPVRLRRGDILRCIETDELCTVWATSTIGKTLIKWSANNFGNYTAEQIGELFWLEPKQEPEQKPMAWKVVPVKPTDEMLKAMDECSKEGYDERLYAGHAASVYMAAVDAAPQRKPLTREQCLHLEVTPFMTIEQVVRVVEAAHGIKGKA